MQSMMAQPLVSSSRSFHARMKFPTGLNRPARRVAACRAILLESGFPVSLKSATAVGTNIKPTSWCRP